MRAVTVRGTVIRESILLLIPDPKCEGCGVEIMRPKCMWEMGSDCPRHDQRDEWQAKLLAAEMAERSCEAADIPMHSE